MMAYKVSKVEKTALTKIKSKILDELPKQSYYPRLNINNKSKIYPTETIGYAVKLFSIKGTTGFIELWLDYFANIGRPTICITYFNKDFKEIEKIKRKIKQVGSTFIITKDDFLESKTGSVLNKPLQNKYFHKFIIEKYQTRNYISFFIKNKINSRINVGLIHEITNAINSLTNLIISTQVTPKLSRSVIENRKKLVTHLKRERSTRLHSMVKATANYTCQICDFNLNRKYDSIGDSAIEVHHINPLGRSKKIVKTTLDNLIAVCANCHHMIHKLGANKTSVSKLKKIIKQKS